MQCPVTYKSYFREKPLVLRYVDLFLYHIIYFALRGLLLTVWCYKIHLPSLILRVKYFSLLLILYSHGPYFNVVRSPSGSCIKHRRKDAETRRSVCSIFTHDNGNCRRLFSSKHVKVRINFFLSLVIGK